MKTSVEITILLFNTVFGLESTTIRPISTNLNLPQDQIPISEDMTSILYHDSTERFMKEVFTWNTENN